MIRIRRAAVGDSSDILDWRNDTITRAMSHESSIVTAAQHARWLAASLISEDRLLFLIEDSAQGATKVAMTRIDRRSGEEVAISINLNPAFRGRGLAKVSIELTLGEVANCWGAKTVVAEIKDENIGSIKTFLGCGFVLRCSKPGFGIYDRAIVSRGDDF